MEIKVIENIDKLVLYKTEWQSILHEMNNDILFIELDWILYWWKFFGDKHKLFVLAIFKNQEIIGFCPLMVTGKRFHNEIGFIGGRESSKMNFILRDKYAEEAIKAMCDFLRDIKGKNIIKFHGISERTLTYSFLKKYIMLNKLPNITSSIICYFLNTKDKDFNMLFEHRFGKKTRQTMINKEKKLMRLGKITYKKISSSEIDDVFEIHEKRWLRKVGNSSFSKGETKRFYKELALINDMKFNIAVDAITLNDKVISFMYGFEYNKKYSFIRIAHDDDFYFLSPGELVFRKKMEECHSTQTDVFDFGLGYEPYKAKWTDDYEEYLNLVLPTKDLKAVLIFYVKYWSTISFIKAIKKNKAIYSFKKYYLGKIKFLLARENIIEAISKVKRVVNRYGILTFLKKILISLSEKIYSFKNFQLLEKELSSAEIPNSELHVIEATINNLEKLSEVMNESPSKIVRRFVSKHRCYVAIHHSQIIYYCWINCSNIEISGVELDIPLEKSCIHMYDIYMKKKYKNEDNYSYILSQIFNLLYKEGFKKCYVVLNNQSKSCENEIMKKLFKPKHKIVEKKILGVIKNNIVT